MLLKPNGQLSKEETANLTFQNGISSWGGRRTLPYAFTEHGGGEPAIIRTFVKLREVMATHEDIARKVAQHDKQIAVLFEHVQRMLALPVTVAASPPRRTLYQWRRE